MWNSILQKQLSALIGEHSRKFFFLTWAFTIGGFCGCFCFVSVFLFLELKYFPWNHGVVELLNAWSLPKVNEQGIVEIAFKFYSLSIGATVLSQLCSKAAECNCKIQYLLLLYAAQTKMNLNVLRHTILSRYMNNKARYFPIHRIQQWIKHSVLRVLAFIWNNGFCHLFQRGEFILLVNSCPVHMSSTVYKKPGIHFLKLVEELSYLLEMKSLSAFYQKWTLTVLLSTADANDVFFYPGSLWSS